MPAAGALARDVQLAGDLGLGVALGEQLGGAFPAGLARRPLLDGALSGLLLAAVGRRARGCSHTTTRPSPQRERLNKAGDCRRADFAMDVPQRCTRPTGQPGLITSTVD
jgi:hypothetical protein